MINRVSRGARERKFPTRPRALGRSIIITTRKNTRDNVQCCKKAPWTEYAEKYKKLAYASNKCGHGSNIIHALLIWCIQFRPLSRKFPRIEVATRKGSPFFASHSPTFARLPAASSSSPPTLVTRYASATLITSSTTKSIVVAEP